MLPCLTRSRIWYITAENGSCGSQRYPSYHTLSVPAEIHSPEYCVKRSQTVTGGKAEGKKENENCEGNKTADGIGD